MTKIKIVTDSTAGLTPEEVAKYNIHILPLTVEIDGKTYNATDIEPADFMAKMAASKQLPKSSQPAIGNFVDLFEELTADGSEVLAIHLTEKLSGTVLTAQQAADMVDGKVTVIDSEYIARALAFQVIEAAKMAQAGTNTVEDILTKIASIRAKTKLYICVVTLENLIKGGRVGRMQGIIGSLLNIKLIAKLQDGGLVEEAKIRSKKKNDGLFSRRIESRNEEGQGIQRGTCEWITDGRRNQSTCQRNFPLAGSIVVRCRFGYLYTCWKRCICDDLLYRVG